MATEDKLVSMAKQFSGLPMKDLIGAPLVAASEANNMMALSQTKFLLETCFELTSQDDKEIHKPIMINMTVTRPVVNADGTPASPVESDFTLPLMTLVPINSLAVDEMSFSFEMEVKSSYASNSSSERSEEGQNEKSIGQTLKKGTVSTELTGSVASSNKSDSKDSSDYKKSNAAKYEINAHAGKLPLPVGVTTIIETFANAISPIQLKNSTPQKQHENSN